MNKIIKEINSIIPTDTEFYDLFIQWKDLSKYKKIVLVACNSDGIAKLLAKRVNIPVEGYDNYVFINDSGQIYAAPYLPNTVNPDTNRIEQNPIHSYQK